MGLATCVDFVTLCVCVCRALWLLLFVQLSGEHFAKGDVDAEWDAVARQFPAWSGGASSKKCLCRCRAVDARD